jgi:hypothetical protein
MNESGARWVTLGIFSASQLIFQSVFKTLMPRYLVRFNFIPIACIKNNAVGVDESR